LCEYKFKGCGETYQIYLFCNSIKLCLTENVIIFVQIFELMETTMITPVILTEKAVTEIKRLMTEPGFDPSKNLRIGVKGGGCSGMTYVLGFDDKQASDDSFEIGGLACIMNPAHGIYLMGMEVDWEDGLNSRGFTFKNPNATKTCGCGTSFAA
jgi:iron-sulfur cluster assembly accessory protein